MLVQLIFTYFSLLYHNYIQIIEIYDKKKNKKNIYLTNSPVYNFHIYWNYNNYNCFFFYLFILVYVYMSADLNRIKYYGI